MGIIEVWATDSGNAQPGEIWSLSGGSKGVLLSKSNHPLILSWETFINLSILDKQIGQNYLNEQMSDTMFFQIMKI